MTISLSSWMNIKVGLGNVNVYIYFNIFLITQNIYNIICNGRQCILCVLSTLWSWYKFTFKLHHTHNNHQWHQFRLNLWHYQRIITNFHINRTIQVHQRFQKFCKKSFIWHFYSAKQTLQFENNSMIRVKIFSRFHYVLSAVSLN